MKKMLFLLFLVPFLSNCKKEIYYNSKVTAKTISIDSLISSDKKITETIAPYKEKMISEINTIISFTPKDITRYDGNMQSSLGNFLADLCYLRANSIFKEKTGNEIDFSLFNYGGIRASINKGVVKNKNAFELMPFENSLVVVELSGEKIIELFDYFIRNKTAHPISSNIELTISEDDSYSLNINKKKFDKTKNYFVLTSDYLQSGGDKMYFFTEPISVFKTDYKMRDAIIDEIKSLDTINVNTDNRVILK